MSTLSDEFRTYLLYRAADALMLESLREEDPGLEERMSKPQTRRTLFSWLDGPEAREEESALLAAAAMQFLHSVKDGEETSIVSRLLDHPHAMVRLRSFEALLIPLFAGGEIERLKPLLRNMLEDSEDLVRSAGARYVRRTATAGALRSFLEEWRAAAPGRGWEGTESFELVTRLLEEG